MPKLRGLSTILFLFFVVAVLAASTWAQQLQQRPPLLEKVVKTIGLDSWDKVEGLRYTWHLQYGKIDLSRSWEWEPKTGKVTYGGKDKDGKPVTVTYMRSELASAPDNVKNDIEPGFVNDNYTFLFPLHAYWDSTPAVIDQGTINLPLGSGSAELLAVKYPAEVGGYTPGDTWELFVGKDSRVQYLEYHRGGDKKPSILYVTWGGQKKVGPLLLSTDHRGVADGQPIRIFFENVAVKLTGSDKWIEAQ
jgi:hypothetical protein